MKIVLSGVETNNKGAELMLYAILQEIERKFPDAKVYIPHSRCLQGLSYIKTSLTFRYTPFSKLIDSLRISRLLLKLHLPVAFLECTSIKRDANWFIDGSGFVFSDQWNPSKDNVRKWEIVLRPLHKRGCKIVFLPQAFGPFEQMNSRKQLSLLSECANLILPREEISYNYLEKSGIVDMRKVTIFPDFTSLVEGVFPVKYDYLKGGICVIPNYQMMDKGKIKYEEYIKLLTAMIIEGKKSGHPVYLLNHEGVHDENLCYKCCQSLKGGIDVVTGLNALEVKGLIGSAYIVITSRFHGLASALNGCVPSLATSWSHKYEELFKDYGMEGYLLPLDDTIKAINRMKELLQPEENLRVRKELEAKVRIQRSLTREMWNNIWNI